jgi:hypothetical protein
MNIPYRPIVIGIASLAFALVLLERAQAGGGHYFAPVTDPVVKEECGGCHLAFAPSMLPAASWQRMMGQLNDHFGDDASVDAQTARRITDYLVANAADTAGDRHGGRMLRGVSLDNPPLRITELPRWQREHRKVRDWEWQDKKVGSKANCVACHADAASGYYEE